MFLITLNKINDLSLFKKIYKPVISYNLHNIMYFELIVDFKNKNYLNKNLILDFISIDLKNTEEQLKNNIISMEEFEEGVYELVDLNKCISIKNYDNSSKLMEVIENIGLDYVVPQKLNEEITDLKEIDTNTQLVIYDFFEKEHKYKKYYPNDFKIRLNINNEGEVFFKNELIFNLSTEDFLSIMNVSRFNINQEDKKESLFGEYFYNPYFYLIENINYEEEIIKIKMSIFNKIKNLKPEEYKDLNEELLELFNKNNFIQMNDIIKIIKHEDETLSLLKTN